MNTSTRLLIFTSILFLLFALAIMVNAAINFRNYGYQNAIEKSKMIAEIVRDGLTAHMVNGIMDKRQFFLDKLSQTNDVEKLWIVRGENVVKQFGPGFGNEKPRDAIDRKVLATGKTIDTFSEDTHKALIRITIPYKATAFDTPNCLSCHHVKEGETLGAISLELDVSNVRTEGIMTLLKIVAITLLFILIAIVAVKRFSRPYLQFFQNLEEALQKTRHGNFEKTVETDIEDSDIRKIADSFNFLLNKFQQTLGNIESKLATLLNNAQSNCGDPLQKASDTIDLLSQTHRFKNTIEHDASLPQIYDRIAEVIKEVTHCHTFTIYAVDLKENCREIVYNTLQEATCHAKTLSEAKECRAVRTDNMVISKQFPQLCPYYVGNFPYYYCLPFTITERYTLVITLLAKDEDEAEHYNRRSSILRYYLENAKPVIESKLLMEKLRQKSLHDGLTGLYNRKFLEEFIDQISLQATRKASTYGILMIDIDFFKKINDSYGHDVGDRFIEKLAHAIQSSIRQSDIAARYGGEEFVVLLYETDLENAHKVAEKIRRRFESETILVQNEHIHASISVGVSHFPTQASTLREGIKYADVALYKAKESGRNRVVIFESEMYQASSY